MPFAGPIAENVLSSCGGNFGDFHPLQTRNAMLGWSFELVPNDQCIIDRMAASVLRCFESDHAALSAVVNHAGDFFEVRMTWPNAMIGKSLDFDNTISNSKSCRLFCSHFCAHFGLRGNPLGGMNCPP